MATDMQLVSDVTFEAAADLSTKQFHFVKLTAANTVGAIAADTDVLVNATSIGLYPAVDELPSLDYATIRPGMVVCDVIPNPPRTRFLEAAQARGARTLDGLGMLVYQGAIALKLWTGRDAPVEVMKAALAAEFSGCVA